MFVELVSALGKEGNFYLGVLLGCLVTLLVTSIASRERIARHKIDNERERLLTTQLKQKDERIDKLHDQVGDLQKEVHKLNSETVKLREQILLSQGKDRT